MGIFKLWPYKDNTVPRDLFKTVYNECVYLYITTFTKMTRLSLYNTYLYYNKTKKCI